MGGILGLKAMTDYQLELKYLNIIQTGTVLNGMYNWDFSLELIKVTGIWKL